MRTRIDPGTIGGLLGWLCFAIAVILCLAFLWVLASPAHALNNGQFDNIDPATRSWFKGVRSPHGVPCCDIADGHKTAYKTDAEGHFYVPINADDPENPWVLVPPEAVVYNAGNPYEEAVVWYSMNGGTGEDGKQIPYIRCFVPVGGV